MSPLILLVPAVTPVGAWTGRFLPKIPVLPSTAPAAMKAKLADDLAKIKRGRFHLVLKADHTYRMRAVDLPMFGKPDTSGKWTQAGSSVLMTESGTTSTHAFLLDAGGKRMTFTLGRTGSQIVFGR